MSRIWIDLSNSPHVLFFAPLIRALQQRGHSLLLSARDFAQTLPLCQQYNLDVQPLGGHGGQGKIRKAINIAGRAAALARFGRAGGADIAVSHNSYAQIVAARLLRIPVLTAMDYEFQPANHLAFRLAHRILLPEGFATTAAQRMGAGHRVARYPGLKEQVYLADFVADPAFPSQRAALFGDGASGAEDDAPLWITVRPPATMAAYHDFENPLFSDVLQHLGALADRARVVILPRTPAQAATLQPQLAANMRIPAQPLHGPNLISHSDLLISAGGTMVREAVALGVPSATIYWGKMAGVDRQLIADGRLTHLQNQEQVAQLIGTLRRHEGPSAGQTTPHQSVDQLSPLLINEIETLLHRRRNGGV